MLFLHLSRTYLCRHLNKTPVILDLPPASQECQVFVIQQQWWHILDLEESWYFLSTCGAISSLYTVSGKLDQKGCIGLWWQQPLCRGKAWPSAVPMLPVVVVSRVTHSEPQNLKKVLFSKAKNQRFF